jgi:predicted Rossmann fold flavoprotein
VDYDAVVIGAGAAGLMCAIEAGKRGRSVVLLECNPAAGRKIRISGGGRCNFTNVYTTPEHFICGNPNFHKSALVRYTPEDFIRMVRRHRIAYHEKKLGQLFCDGTSEQITAMLLKECAAAQVDVRFSCAVTDIKKDERFRIATNQGMLECSSLVIATGGLSVAKIGATDLGYRIARQFGLRVTALRPGLVPLTLDEDEGRAFRRLSGVSLDADVTCGPVSFRENILFTHRGLSGPAILQISSYWQPDTAILVQPKQLPRRFVQTWRQVHGTDPIDSWSVMPSGTEGYPKAEVTVGGVDTTELSSKTMEARRVPGLYFVGEVVDVTGHLGGFNFQWAWASGFAAGQYV